MRRAVSLLALALSCPAALGDAVLPPLPEPAYPVLAAFSYADEAAARRVWRPVGQSLPVSVVKIADRQALKMRCAFKGTKLDRACWDGFVNLDLAASRGLQFQFLCPDPLPISGFTVYLHSGEGWYVGGMSSEKATKWRTIRIDKHKTRSQGKPGGWSAIDRIRIAAWRGREADVDTEFYLADLGKLGQEKAEISIILVQATTPRGRQWTQALVTYLDTLGLPYRLLAEGDIGPDRLKGIALVILPDNPSLADKQARTVAAFVRAGGKLLSFHSLPPGLRPLAGIELGQDVSIPFHYVQTLNSIRVDTALLPGAPAVIKQGSWAIRQARPTKARVAGAWHDSRGSKTAHAAILMSDACIHMTHGLSFQYEVTNRGLLRAMVGRLVPRLWRISARKAVEGIGRFGAYEDLAAAARDIRRRGQGAEAVEAALGKADRLRGRADKLLSASKFPEAAAAAEQAQEALREAHFASLRPAGKEHRAFWAHGAFPVGKSWDEDVKLLAENGFTCLIVNMLWGGVTNYPSEVLPITPEAKEKGDQLAECLAACRKHGIECHVWKVCWQFGRRTEFSTGIQNAGGRTLVGFDGSKNDWWLCPSHPENRKLEIDSMLEVARNYSVDGLHFDYIRYPSNHYCFCAGCRGRFEKRIGRKVQNWPAEVRTDERLKRQWQEFRRDNITSVVAEVRRGARKIRPGTRISAAVFSDWATAARAVRAQDWKLWCEKGYLDFVCPMNYTSDNARFEKWVKAQMAWAGKVPCYPGIGFSGFEPPGRLFRVAEQIDTTRRLNTRGFIIFQWGEEAADALVPLLGKGMTRKK